MAAGVQELSPRDAWVKVELSISCSGLADLDTFSKSDPVVYLYQRGGGGGGGGLGQGQQRQGALGLGRGGRGVEWVRIGRTEVVMDNLNPQFAKTFVVEYRFEEVQNLKFSVCDVDNFKEVESERKQEAIGYVECTLADIVTAGQKYTRNLRLPNDPRPRGKITIQSEEVQDSKMLVHMQLSASKLDKKDLFGKSDPFLEIAKAQEGGSFSVVYRSQPIMKTLNPRWPSFEISSQKLCSGDLERTLKFTVWDWNRSGNHDFIGSCTTSLTDICPERGGQRYNLELINPEKKRKKKYTNSGTLVMNTVRTSPIYTFLDYITGGCDISLMLAVDFTASNGKPYLPSSLHFNSPYQENEYVQAIRSVASVLAPYDSDQMIPTFGFGARLPPNGEVSHCFPLNFNWQNPQVYGVQGVLDSYRYTLSQVDLFGPTNFSSFLDKAIEYSRGSVSQQSQNYNILLIITDGVISDMSRTVDRIVAASKLPLSIVIVGVGAADFSNMEILDADDVPLRDSSGQLMSRDIVQFVPFRQFHSKSGADFSLAREVLAEIPEQLASFMKARGIKPNPPPLRTRDSVTSVIVPPGTPIGTAPPPLAGPSVAPPFYPSGTPGQVPAGQYSMGTQPQPPYPSMPTAPYPTAPQQYHQNSSLYRP